MDDRIKHPSTSRDPSADAPTEPAGDSIDGDGVEPRDKAKEERLKKVGRDDHEKARPRNTGRMGA